MKNKNFLIGILAITLVFAMTAIGCDLFNKNDDDEKNNNTTAVTFNSVTADGSSSQTTTQLTLTFSQAITGLSASNITLSGVSGVSKGTLSSSGTTYTLPISGFTAGGTLTVAVAKSGYTISGSSKTVTIFYNGGSSGGGDSMTWTAVTDSKFENVPINGIVYGNGKFVAIGSVMYSATQSIVSKMAYSSDGITWTPITDSTFNNKHINSIAYGNGKFVAGGWGYMAYSSDGITWTAVTDSAFGNNIIYAITYDNSKFVAVGQIGKIATSTDGVTWTAVNTGTIFDYTSGDQKTYKADIRAIVYGNNKFVAVCERGKMAYSLDGTTWTTVTDSTFGTISIIYAIAYGNNKFVAVGGSGKMATSPDGITWTAVVDSTFGTSIYTIAYGNNKFVAGGDNGKMTTSSDGVTWTAVADSTIGSNTIRAITYGNGKFVAGSESGKMAYSSGGTGNNGGGQNDPGDLAGTWKGNIGGYNAIIVISGTGWTMTASNNQNFLDSGYFIRNGTTLTLYLSSGTNNGTATIINSTSMQVVLNNNTIFPGTYTLTKQL